MAESLVEVSERVMGEYYPHIEVYACVGEEEMEIYGDEEEEEEEEEKEGGMMRTRKGFGGQWRRLN